MLFCIVKGCENVVHAKWYCKKHYQRLNEYGRLDKVMTGVKTKHPLYQNWTARRQKDGAFVQLWIDDFDAYVKAVGKQPENTYLARIRSDEPCGPNNFYWRPVSKRKLNETDKERRSRSRKSKLLENPELYRELNYKYKFNITLARYNEMLAAQNFVCAICEQPEIHEYKNTGKVRNLAVDHDHKTGKIRSLLCSDCNLAIGTIEDAGKLFDKMLLYLKIHSS